MSGALSESLGTGEAIYGNNVMSNTVRWNDGHHPPADVAMFASGLRLGALRQAREGGMEPDRPLEYRCADGEEQQSLPPVAGSIRALD